MFVDFCHLNSASAPSTPTYPLAGTASEIGPDTPHHGRTPNYALYLSFYLCRLPSVLSSESLLAQASRFFVTSVRHKTGDRNQA